MPYLNSPVDGARLFYADYRPLRGIVSISGQHTSHAASTPSSGTVPQPFTLVFIHGWPMSHEMYTHLMLALSQQHQVRCIGVDRRGFGKSEWIGAGADTDDTAMGMEITYDTFAQDTAAVLRHAKIQGAWAWVAASMGAGETVLAQEVLRANTSAAGKENNDKDLANRCMGFVWMGPSVPFPLQSDKNPTAPPRELWDSILGGLREDRVGFVRVAIGGVFGTREESGLGIELPPTKIEYFEHVIRQADALAMERCVRIMTATDLTEQLKRMEKRVLILHGDSDQGMPASASADLVKALVPNNLCEVRIYDKAAHGLYLTHAERVMKDLLEFVVSVSAT